MHGALFIVLLEVHGADVVVDAEDDGLAVLDLGVEEIGQGVAQEEAVVVAVEVDGAVHRAVESSFDLETIEFGYGWQHRVTKFLGVFGLGRGLLPFHEAVHPQVCRGVLITVQLQGDLLEEVRELGTRLRWIHSDGFRDGRVILIQSVAIFLGLFVITVVVGGRVIFVVEQTPLDLHAV